jgi:hypothetical protein
MISGPNGGLVPQTNPNQSVMNIFGVSKYTVNSTATRRRRARFNGFEDQERPGGRWMTAPQ